MSHAIACVCVCVCSFMDPSFQVTKFANSAARATSAAHNRQLVQPQQCISSATRATSVAWRFGDKGELSRACSCNMLINYDADEYM